MSCLDGPTTFSKTSFLMTNVAGPYLLAFGKETVNAESFRLSSGNHQSSLILYGKMLSSLNESLYARLKVSLE